MVSIWKLEFDSIVVVDLENAERSSPIRSQLVLITRVSEANSKLDKVNLREVLFTAVSVRRLLHTRVSIVQVLKHASIDIALRCKQLLHVNVHSL